MAVGHIKFSTKMFQSSLNFLYIIIQHTSINLYLRVTNLIYVVRYIIQSTLFLTHNATGKFYTELFFYKRIFLTDIMILIIVGTPNNKRKVKSMLWLITNHNHTTGQQLRDSIYLCSIVQFRSKYYFVECMFGKYVWSANVLATKTNIESGFLEHKFALGNHLPTLESYTSYLFSPYVPCQLVRNRKYGIWL